MAPKRVSNVQLITHNDPHSVSIGREYGPSFIYSSERLYTAVTSASLSRLLLVLNRRRTPGRAWLCANGWAWYRRD